MSSWAVALCVAAMLAVADGCVYLYGTEPDSLATHPNGTRWDYSRAGSDWVGETNGNPWVCATGTHQSPINIPIDKGTNGDFSLRTKWSYPPVTSDGSNIDIINNGHVIQVEWRSNQTFNMSIVADASVGANIVSVLNLPNAAAGTKVVTAHPLQFHFHSGSEHYMFGHDYPLELHIVQTIAKSELAACNPVCYAVTGVLIELRDGPDNPAFDFIFNNIPLREGTINHAPAGAVLDFSKILPAEGDQAYYQYYGSLTTPPCSEGLLWHVLEKPNYISMHQYQQLMTAVNDKDCTAADPAAATNGTNRRHLAHSHTHAHRKLVQDNTHSHDHRRARKLSHSNLEAALSTLPSSFEVSAAQLHNVRRNSVGQAILESSPLHRLLTAEGVEPTNMVCVVHAYSKDFRLVQPMNSRILKYFADPTASRQYDCSKSMRGNDMKVDGKIIKTKAILSDGFSAENQARNQEQCKSSCDKTTGCTGFMYKSDRSCTLFKNIAGWVPADGANFYDSCRLVEA